MQLAVNPTSSYSLKGFGALTENDLRQVQGGVAPLVIYAVRIGGGAVVGAVGGAVGSYITTGKVNTRAVVAGAAVGALGGAWGGFLKVKGL